MNKSSSSDAVEALVTYPAPSVYLFLSSQLIMNCEKNDTLGPLSHE
jgi:hypothetical protein